MAECYLHFWLRFRVKYLRSNEQSLNLVVKNWNNKCRQIFKKKVIFLPEFPFKHFGRLLAKIYLMYLTPSKTDGRVPSQQGAPTTYNLTYWEVSQQTYVQTLLSSLGVVIGQNSVLTSIQIPSDTLNCLFPSNTFLPRTYYSFQVS